MNWELYLSEMKKWEVISVDPKSLLTLSYVTSLSPKEYLDYADKDLLRKDNHGYLNSLTNAKRAIDCQITNLLSVLGLKKTGNIHKKIERIEEIGILAPRILKKVNKIRNLLEHEFQKPTVNEAEDAVDIATLFIASTEKVFMNFMDSFWVAREGSENRPEIYKEGKKTIIMDDTFQTTFSDGVFVEFDEETRDYGVWGYLNNEEVFEASVEKSSPLHIELIKYSTLNHNTVLNYDEDLAGKEFFRRVSNKDGISL